MATATGDGASHAGEAAAAGSGVQIRAIATPTHGRYLLRRPAGKPTLLLVGFHGYRENATRHLVELERIPGAQDWALLAIDALHAFYAGATGEVLRGWMTRELREEAIADNVAYVRRILDAVRPEIGWTVPLAFLGFSQGASMAWRAALLAGHGGAPAPKVVALAGDIPPELASARRQGRVVQRQKAADGHSPAASQGHSSPDSDLRGRPRLDRRVPARGGRVPTFRDCLTRHSLYQQAFSFPRCGRFVRSKST
jgi:predicted esterase